MSAMLAIRHGLIAAIVGLFAVFYSMGAAYTDWGRLLSAFGVTVLLATGLMPYISKLAKFAVATVLLLAGLLPFGIGSLDWEGLLLIVLEMASFAALVVAICPPLTVTRDGMVW